MRQKLPFLRVKIAGFNGNPILGGHGTLDAATTIQHENLFARNEGDIYLVPNTVGAPVANSHQRTWLIRKFESAKVVLEMLGMRNMLLEKNRDQILQGRLTNRWNCDSIGLSCAIGYFQKTSQRRRRGVLGTPFGLG